MNKKEIVNVHKRLDGIFEIECFEKPLRTQIANLEQENKQLKERSTELENEAEYKSIVYKIADIFKDILVCNNGKDNNARPIKNTTANDVYNAVYELQKILRKLNLHM